MGGIDTALAGFVGCGKLLWRQRGDRKLLTCSRPVSLSISGGGGRSKKWIGPNAREVSRRGNVSVQAVKKPPVAAEMELNPAATGRGGQMVVWLQDVLRLHDNPALSFAAEDASSVLVIYIFDRRITHVDRREDAQKVRFLMDSLEDLRRSLRKMGSDLALIDGEPEKIIPKICKGMGARALAFHRAVTKPGIEIERRLMDNLEDANVESNRLWSSTMYRLEDTPFNLRTIPWEYEQFEKEVNRDGVLRESLPKLTKLPPPPSSFDFGSVPTWISKVAGEGVREGGETAALKVLEDKLANELRNSKNLSITPWSIGPWLELGCLSPRLVKEKILKIATKLTKERLRTLNTELILWDFFRFISLVKSIMNIEAHLPKESKSIIP
ncbi:hypothetical protein NDN08_003729 [Rhodosorus marinus]|uniref:Photolyase/cryptochrome alpha/beta domain-containing protein n=1 Tax=Rhodosorus marinus TaxID=101924 RepID=A0AAV8UXC6_9RHOD|nr:hypothetical protein NDN08_003729 [Rhodosorus marinus]